MIKKSRFDSQQGQDILSCPHGAKIGFVAHQPASYSIGTLQPEAKTSGRKAEHSLPSSAEVNQ
jgi:hypothetical protein